MWLFLRLVPCCYCCWVFLYPSSAVLTSLSVVVCGIQKDQQISSSPVQEKVFEYFCCRTVPNPSQNLFWHISSPSSSYDLATFAAAEKVSPVLRADLQVADSLWQSVLGVPPHSLPPFSRFLNPVESVSTVLPAPTHCVPPALLGLTSLKIRTKVRYEGFDKCLIRWIGSKVWDLKNVLTSSDIHPVQGFLKWQQLSFGWHLSFLWCSVWPRLDNLVTTEHTPIFLSEI